MKGGFEVVTPHEYRIIDIYMAGLYDRYVRVLCNDGEIFSLDYDYVISCIYSNILKIGETIEPRKHIKKLSLI